MAMSAILPQILRTYALRFNDPFIGIEELADYLQKYAKKNASEKPEYAAFIGITEKKLITELETLEAEGKAELVDDVKKGRLVFVPFYFIDTVARQYERIREKPETPFPLASGIPEDFSKRFLRSIRVDHELADLQQTAGGDTFLYRLSFPGDTPPLIFPGTFSTDKLLEFAIAKLRFFFQKDELKEFIQKKLIAVDPGKEYYVRKFILTVQANSPDALRSFKSSGEVYLYWGYLCSVIKQELVKKPEKMSDEITLLQAVFIIEYLNTYYRTVTQKALQRETALKNLSLAFQRPPYYFDRAAIVNFTDSRGVPLLGQYSQEDLEEYIRERTTSPDKISLPELLHFKTASGELYYILPDKMIPLIVSLTNENRKQVRDVCLKKWYRSLTRFEKTDAMQDDAAFNRLLESLCAEYVPILPALLDSPFLFVLATDKRIMEHQAAEIQRIVPNGTVLPYTDLLLIKRQELLSDARILLPFWYTVPIISSIIAFFMRPKNKKTPTHRTDDTESVLEVRETAGNADSRKKSMREISDELRTAFVPEDKDLDDCIVEQLDAWNTTIDPEVRKQNTDNVNAFIRDRLKTLHKMQSFSKFTSDTVRELADSMMKAPGLAKVKNKTALRAYIEYYIVWLVLHSV